MNERIEKLARLAGGKSTYGTLRGPIVPPPPGWFDRTTVDLEKFAELIVKECTNICDLAADNHADEITPLMADKLIIAGAKEQAAKLSLKIKEHFGVEE